MILRKEGTPRLDGGDFGNIYRDALPILLSRRPSCLHHFHFILGNKISRGLLIPDSVPLNRDGQFLLHL